jgi:hypothetical protein
MARVFDHNSYLFETVTASIYVIPESRHRAVGMKLNRSRRAIGATERDITSIGNDPQLS